MIRRARESELPRLAEVERAAGEQFREIGMPQIADDEPPAPGTLLAALRRDELWVWAEPDGPALAYLLLDDVDGATHVEQVSVHPSAAGRSLGRALIEAAVARAERRGEDRVTLTTFADVPWNRPYYERLGFTVVPVEDLGPQLRRVRAHEADLGLDRWPRVAMARFLPGPLA